MLIIMVTSKGSVYINLLAKILYCTFQTAHYTQAGIPAAAQRLFATDRETGRELRVGAIEPFEPTLTVTCGVHLGMLCPRVSDAVLTLLQHKPPPINLCLYVLKWREKSYILIFNYLFS